MFTTKSEIKDRIVKSVLKDRAEQKAKYDKEKEELEERLRGEFELIIQELKAKIQLYEEELKVDKEFIRGVEDVYSFCWEMINRNEAIANYFIMQREKIEKHFGYIFQSLTAIKEQTENNKRVMIEKDNDNRTRLHYNSKLKAVQ